jgi:hypothetical protein
LMAMENDCRARDAKIGGRVARGVAMDVVAGSDVAIAVVGAREAVVVGARGMVEA